MFVLQAVLLAASTHPLLSSAVLVDQAFPLVGLGAVIGAGIGLLIVTRYPRNVIGWLFLIGQLGSITGLAADAFTVLVVDGTVDAPLAGQLCAYVKRVFDATYTMVFLSIIFMIAPDGRPLSPRWWFALAVPITAFGLRLGVLLAQPPSDLVPGAEVQLGTLATTLLLLDVAALLLSLALGAAALVIRMRRATAQQRIQLRWVASAAAVVAVALLIYILGQLLLTSPPWLLAEGLYLAYIYVSVAVGIAILKYRLYDIDVILSRAIVLAVLIAFVTVGYVAVVVLIGVVLSATGAPGTTLYWPSLVATALVAVAFQPLRRHVVRLADQLVYGRRALPYEALTTLSRRLADARSPDTLPTTVAEATGRAVGAASTRVTIGAADGPNAGSAWSADPFSPAAPTASPELILPVLDLGERVGTIEVFMPPGRALRSFERRLLKDVAAQAGVAFRNALLEAELSTAVAREREQSAGLAASRRRLVGAEDEARARLAEDIRTRVVPHLLDIETTVGTAVGTAVPDGVDHVTPVLLDQLLASAERAVQELRVVVRGVFPALLERRGLIPALADRLATTQPSVRLAVEGSARQRLDPAVETAGYVFCEEISSSGELESVHLAVEPDPAGGGRLCIRVTLLPDPAQGVPGNRQHAWDRVAALGGHITTRPCDGGPGAIEVCAAIPLSSHDDAEPSAARQVSTSLSGPKADLGM